MELHEALLRVRFDVRLIDWHLNQGLITKGDLEKFINALPDSSGSAVPLNLETRGGDDVDLDS
ncbi:MAG: hypothetical protein K1X29_02130 [Bdellovibrionales bacterium]|nr:hypothetical protein [Bdellovibrionales bacterium]